MEFALVAKDTTVGNVAQAFGSSAAFAGDSSTVTDVQQVGWVLLDKHDDIVDGRDGSGVPSSRVTFRVVFE